MDDWRGRALVPQPRRAAGGRRSRRHVYTSASRTKRGPGDRGRARRRRRAALSLYTESGRRRILPPLILARAFCSTWRGAGATTRSSIPARSRSSHSRRQRSADGVAILLVADWFEVWTRAYWEEYVGHTAGRIGWLVQRACIRLRHQAFCFSQLHARRLREEGLRGDVVVLAGLSAEHEPYPRVDAEPLVVFAGRHIPEKRVPTLVPAIAAAQLEAPNCGPRSMATARSGTGCRRRARIRPRRHRRASGVRKPRGIDQALGRALCLVLPSRREGYGLVVVEAASRGTPSVVVAGADNAAVELLQDGVNGSSPRRPRRATWPPRSCVCEPQGRASATRRPPGPPRMSTAFRSQGRSTSWPRRTPAR